MPRAASAGEPIMAFKILVIVKPRAKKEGIENIAEGEYRVSVHAPPRAGKANQALIELIARHFSVPKSAVRIVRGQSSRKKIVKIG